MTEATPPPAVMPTWAKVALGLGGATLVGGAVYYATRDDDDDDDEPKQKQLPKRARKSAPARRRGKALPRRGTKPRRKKKARGRGRDEPAPAPRGNKPAPRRDEPPPPLGPTNPPRQPKRNPRPKRKSRPRNVDPVPANTDPSSGTVKDKLAGGVERRNAAIAVVAQPNSHAERGKTKDPGQTLTDWLTDVAYWSTYKNAPTKIDPKDNGHKKYIKAWLRLRSYVAKGLSLLPQLGDHPVDPSTGEKGKRNWQRWALAVAFSSPLRTSSQLREAKRKAWHYVFLDPKGVTWQHEKMVLSPGGATVTLEGLIADAAVHLGTKSFPEAHRTLAAWPQSMTKAFASANRTTEA